MQYDMAPQEIINELNRIKPHTDGVNDVDRRDRAIEAAKDAVRKQIPCHPVAQGPDGQCYPSSKSYHCPVCFNEVFNDFCDNCGQALNWEINKDINMSDTERFCYIIKNAKKQRFNFMTKIKQGYAFVNCEGSGIVIDIQTSYGTGRIALTDPEEAAIRLANLKSEFLNLEKQGVPDER